MSFLRPRRFCIEISNLDQVHTALPIMSKTWFWRSLRHGSLAEATLFHGLIGPTLANEPGRGLEAVLQRRPAGPCEEDGVSGESQVLRIKCAIGG
jgi:hypothetical protein